MKKALYRTFRPKTFDEVLDQDHITRVLKNQVKTGNIGHAYIFSGERGTGKTSCAKIFSRAVNCLHPVDGNPCNKCENCRAILDETTMDVVEMDAASNRRIDDIRELRETVIYPPAKLKYKVYIIDEAHMITKEAFNALLKIMEEPPSHLVFVLATTEIDKVPATILSRTQRYEFYRIGLPAIEKEIRMITGQLQVEIEEEAIHGLALSADGAMRDALSLLDQVLATDQRPVTEELVNQVLGSIGLEDVHKLASFILNDDIRGALTHTEDLYQQGKDAHSLSHELILYFQRLLLLAGGVNGRKLNLSSEDREKMEVLAKKTSLNRLVDSLHILIQTDLDMRKADYPEALFEACLVRLLDYVSEKEIVSRLEAVEAKLGIVDRWKDPEPLIRANFKELIQEEGLAQLGQTQGPREDDKEEGALIKSPEETKTGLEASEEEESKPENSKETRPKAGEAEKANSGLESSEEAREEVKFESEDFEKAGSRSNPAKALDLEAEDLEQGPGVGDSGPENIPASKSEKKASSHDKPERKQSVSPAGGEEQASKSKKSPNANEFEADPDSWLDAHREELIQKNLLNPHFAGKYQAVDVRGKEVFLTYTNSYFRDLLKGETGTLENFLHDKTGQPYKIKIVDKRPGKKQNFSSARSSPAANQPAQAKKSVGNKKIKAEPTRGEDQEVKPKEEDQEKKGASKQDPIQDPILDKLKGLVPEELIEIQKGTDPKGKEQ